MQRGIGLKISQEREITPTDISADKDIAAKTTTTDATADARHRNVLMVLMVLTIKKNEALERYSTNDAHRHPF